METVQVSAGPIEYTDTGGDGRVLVLLHGLAMDGRLWSGVTDELGDGWRCVMPMLRRLPFTFGRMSKHGVPDDLMRGWLAPLARREIRRDLAKYAGDAWRGRRDMLAATLSTFERPVLVVWAPEDEMMRPPLGARLAAAFPNARLVEVFDSYTLVPIDQPQALAAALREFAGD
jgi:pimeloyl-ACP methyl ester carboxylesterase